MTTRSRVASFGAPLALAIVAASLVACASGPPYLPAPTPNDVVDVGYGRQEKRDVTGAVSSVDVEAAMRNAPRTVVEMIDGRFPGVEVRRSGNGLSIHIRGERSMRKGANEEPLFVVDGVPQVAGSGGVLTDIQPREITAIEVLKDAGATAVYGSRGANGVVLISTRRQR